MSVNLLAAGPRRGRVDPRQVQSRGIERAHQVRDRQVAQAREGRRVGAGL